MNSEHTQTPADGRHDRLPTAPVPGPYGWADDFLSHVPFEALGASLLHFVGDVVEGALGSHDGSKLFSELARSLPTYDPTPEDEQEIETLLDRSDWRAVIDHHLFAFDLQEIFASFAGLYAFARGGEGQGHTPYESREQIEEVLAQYQKLKALISAEIAAKMQHWPWLADTLVAAETRWALDHGVSVLPTGLAILAGVKPKTLANLIASKTLASDPDGSIPAAIALDYLGRRKDFVPSSWQEPSQAPEAAPADTGTLTDPVWLPVDGDGQPFLPSLARRSRDGGEPRYAIGDKATPEYIGDYWQALERLSRMPIPRWRRPNAQGNWGLVTAQDTWKRFARADIERMIDAARRSEG